MSLLLSPRYMNQENHSPSHALPASAPTRMPVGIDMESLPTKSPQPSQEALAESQRPQTGPSMPPPRPPENQGGRRGHWQEGARAATEQQPTTLIIDYIPDDSDDEHDSEAEQLALIEYSMDDEFLSLFSQDKRPNRKKTKGSARGGGDIS